MAKINIEVAERPNTIEVELGGVEYTCYPLKMTTVANLAGSLKRVEEDPTIASKLVGMLVKQMFVEEDREKVAKRLRDPNDALDFPHIMALAHALVEEQTGNPTM